MDPVRRHDVDHPHTDVLELVDELQRAVCLPVVQPGSFASDLLFTTRLLNFLTSFLS
jgi:hypothetical protein